MRLIWTSSFEKRVGVWEGGLVVLQGLPSFSSSISTYGVKVVNLNPMLKKGNRVSHHPCAGWVSRFWAVEKFILTSIGAEFWPRELPLWRNPCKDLFVWKNVDIDEKMWDVVGRYLLLYVPRDAGRQDTRFRTSVVIQEDRLYRLPI
jgi:hypothetical protein